MAELVEVASNLKFPEGPIAMPDGTVILVEMFGPRLSRVHPDGTVETIAEVTTRLIVNRASLKTKHKKISRIIEDLEKVISEDVKISG